jgi:hypothetical protein
MLSVLHLFNLSIVVATTLRDVDHMPAKQRLMRPGDSRYKCDTCASTTCCSLRGTICRYAPLLLDVYHGEHLRKLTARGGWQSFACPFCQPHCCKVQACTANSSVPLQHWYLVGTPHTAHRTPHTCQLATLAIRAEYVASVATCHGQNKCTQLSVGHDSNSSSCSS